MFEKGTLVCPLLGGADIREEYSTATCPLPGRAGVCEEGGRGAQKYVLYQVEQVSGKSTVT